jgi:hypothetical protein
VVAAGRKADPALKHSPLVFNIGPLLLQRGEKPIRH